jgi:hypothetical protein
VQCRAKSGTAGTGSGAESNEEIRDNVAGNVHITKAGAKKERSLA